MPRTRTQMRRIREVLRLKFDMGLSDTRVALGARVARATVQDYLHRLAATGLDHVQLLALDDKALDEKLFPPREARDTARPLPDWEAIEQQLRGRGVTLRLLWLEYLDGQTGGYLGCNESFLMVAAQGGRSPTGGATVRKLGLRSFGERELSVDHDRLADWMDLFSKGSAHCPAATSPIIR